VSDEPVNEATARAGRLGTPTGTIEREIQDFLTDRTKITMPADQDLFASGLVSSVFAMELIVHLEEAYSIAIVGSDLKLDNFRTIERMTALVTRLQNLAAAAGA
jgi:methoxymalonate biosynthesis acyl carrier protein